MIKLALALLILIATSLAVAAQERTACRAEWTSEWAGKVAAWRTVDGKQCWYQGERGRPRELLYWPSEEPAPQPPVTPPADDKSVPPVSHETTSADTLTDEDRKLLETYWPDPEPEPGEVAMFPEFRWWPENVIAAMLEFVRVEPPIYAAGRHDAAVMVLVGALVIVMVAMVTLIKLGGVSHGSRT